MENLNNCRILIVDDNVQIHKDFEKILAPKLSNDNKELELLRSALFGDEVSEAHRDFELDFASQGQEAVDMVRVAVENNRPFALVFMDIRMPPGIDGISATKQLWNVDPHVNVIICSAYSDYSWEQILQELGSNGKWVILKKPFDPIEVQQLAVAFLHKWDTDARTRISTEELRELVMKRTEELQLKNQQLCDKMTHLKRARRHIIRLASRDRLTRLYNRRYFERHLERRIENVSSTARMGVIAIDLGCFKRINDTYGHSIGDSVLQTIALRLKNSLRHNPGKGNPDCVARFDGDEFAVLLGTIHQPREAAIVAERLQVTIREPIEIGEHEVSLCSSMGIAIFPNDGADSATLLQNAASALYRAKRMGRNAVEYYVEVKDHSASNQLNLERDLFCAIERKEFELHFQPLIDLKSSMVVGAEALIRWHHPQRGPISPVQFIPLAEDLGLIGTLGEWVLRNACRQAARWRTEGIQLEVLAVNVSAKQVTPPFFELVKSALEDAQLPPGVLELELTESSLFADEIPSTNVLHKIRELGVRIALDDFGTGFSTLTRLIRFPIDTIKIDRSFVSDIPRDKQCVAIIRAIIAIAASMRVRVVGEGIEREEQHQFLKECGCDVMQGFWVSPPLASTAFASLFWVLRKANDEFLDRTPEMDDTATVQDMRVSQ